MTTYVERVAGYLLDGMRRPSQAALAKEIGVREETLCRWLRHRPEFRAWVCTQLGCDDDLSTRLIRSRIAGQALAGSERQQRIWFELRGELGRSAEAGGLGKLGDGWVVNIAVPLTPAPAPAAIDVTAVQS